MRTDFSAAFETQLTRAGREPVQLLEFYFPIAGTVRVSDRDLGPLDGLANSWAGLVEDWGTLQDIVATDPGQVTIEARQISVTLINRGETPFSDYFLKEDPEGVTVALYQWFEGLTDADRVLIDLFMVADPIQFSERSRLVTMDLVSAIVGMDATIGTLLSAADWPNAKGDDIGKAIDVAFGSVGRLPALCAKTAPSATLNGSILANTLAIDTHENLDDLGFAAAGTIQISEELLRYESRSATTFNIVQRGYLTTAAEHLDRVEVIELITDHTYLTCKGPVAAIDAVQVGGYPAPAEIYSVAPETDPAQIQFFEKPYAYRFAAGSTFLNMQFDATAPDNTAFQAYKAYDAGDDATAARIDEDNRVLALNQVTVNADRGAIVKAYLAIEHWETNTIINDMAEVWVEGVGVVGRLSRPNENEGINIDAEVDIDHGHSHEIGQEHTHSFRDPTLQTNENEHTHTSSEGGVSSLHDADTPSFSLRAPYDYEQGDWIAIRFPSAPTSWDAAILRFSCNVGGTKLKANNQYVASGTRALNIPAESSNSAKVFIFMASGDHTYNAQANIWNVQLEVITSSTINAAFTGANTQVAISGRNDPVASDKKESDVNDLTTDNVALTINETQSSTRSHVNLFDLTEQVAFDWAWFTNRQVKVSYTGSDDKQAVYILHAFFDVEYRARERFFSDDVSAQVTGLIDDGAGTYTGTPSALITRPDHVAKWLLVNPGAMAADLIDQSTYEAAGARCAVKSYTIDGVLRGSITVKEAIKAVAYQGRIRPYWSAGFAKLAFVEALADWPEQNPITADQYQLNSMAITRQPAAAIVNQVDLFFARDWTNDETGPDGFADSVRTTDANSVARFGVRNDPSRFLFDLVRNPAMAADLAAFYVDRFSTPSSYYKLNAYLEKFDLEKEDKIILSAPFNKMRKAKMRVLSASRVFGSGKNTTINHVSLLLECLRYILIEQGAADTVLALDALNTSIGNASELSEAIAALDQINVTAGGAMADSQAVSDILSMVYFVASQFLETVTANDALSLNIGIGANDTVAILDTADGWRQFGFGGGQFGVVGFGGWIVWANRAPDQVAVFESLLIDLVGAAFGDAVTAADDAFYMSSGFGCPVGSGFGAAPWGK